jgi:uncharacterized membrane protein
VLKSVALVETRMKTLVAYVAAGLTFLVLDLVWLGYVAYGFYRNELGPLLAEPFNIPAAAAFYFVFLVGLTYFAIIPALAEGGVWRALMLGAMFGFFCYATYDLTNLATIKGFPIRVALIDMAWGAALSGLSAAAGAKAASLL